MRAKRLTLLKMVAAMVVIIFGLWLVQHVRERYKAAERESYYQTVLTNFTGELKPGISPEDAKVEVQKLHVQD